MAWRNRTPWRFSFRNWLHFQTMMVQLASEKMARTRRMVCVAGVPPMIMSMGPCGGRPI
jgi:hypothetical protein